MEEEMKTIALALMASAILGFGTLALGNGACTSDAAGLAGNANGCSCAPCPGPCVPGGCCE
jgi:hypothetical protein